MASRPIIANEEIELDVRDLTLNDGDPVNTWPDSSGNGNDASGINTPLFVENGWTLGIDAVRLQDTGIVPNDDEAFSYDGSFFLNSDFTIFAVFEILDISGHFAIIGSTSASTPPRIVYLFGKSTGELIFNRGFDPYDVISAAGVIEQGKKYVVTARFAGINGMDLRVNGQEVAANPLATADIVDYAAPRIGQVNDQTTGGIGQVFGIDKHFAYINCYSGAATDQEVAQMEAYLLEAFRVLETVWVPTGTQVPVGTDWEQN